MNRAINVVLSRDPFLTAHSCCYVDDIVLFASTPQILLEVLRAAFKVLRETGFTLNNSKTDILPEKVAWCGHILSAEGVTVNTEKLCHMLDIQTPKNKKELKRILGGCQYFANFLPGYHHDVSTLLELLKTTAKYRWTLRHEEALNRIKESLKNVPTLAFPDEDKMAGPMVLTCDASTVAVAGFLSQYTRDRQKEVLLGCFGRSLRPNERNWAINELELLSVIIGLQKYRHLLIGRNVIIRSDSKMVKFVKQMKITPSARHCRWLLNLSPLIDVETTTFDFISGKNNLLADYLSRKSYPPRGRYFTGGKRSDRRRINCRTFPAVGRIRSCNGGIQTR